jgi:hypothetical protein
MMTRRLTSNGNQLAKCYFPPTRQQIPRNRLMKNCVAVRSGAKLQMVPEIGSGVTFDWHPCITPVERVADVESRR